MPSSNTNWATLIDYLGGTSVAGGKLKQTGTTLWNSPNTGATNDSGFNALPAGTREASNTLFNDIGVYGLFWSSSESDNSSNNNATKIRIRSNTSGTGNMLETKRVGISVRCIKN